MTTDQAGEGRGRTPRSVRAARWVLFGLLLVSAVLTLVGLPELQRAVARGAWPPIALAAPPALLAIFVVGFAAYRIVLVRAGRYPAGKALVQIAVMAVLLGVVAGMTIVPGAPPPPGEGPVELVRPLRSSDPVVRAMAAELVRHRPREVALPHVSRLIELLGDRSPEVRRQARMSLAALAGEDLGEGPDARERWRRRWEPAGDR